MNALRATPAVVRAVNSIMPGAVICTNRCAAAAALGTVALSQPAGCGIFARGRRELPELEFNGPVYAAATRQTPSRVARVLSGRSARGFSHLGALRLLKREGLRPDLIVGTGAGATVGAVRARVISVSLGPVPGQHMEAYLSKCLKQPPERFAWPFPAVAADMHGGDIVPLNRERRGARAAAG